MLYVYSFIVCLDTNFLMFWHYKICFTIYSKLQVTNSNYLLFIQAYKMSSTPRGEALIINNKTFSEASKLDLREGSLKII